MSSILNSSSSIFPAHCCPCALDLILLLLPPWQALLPPVPFSHLHSSSAATQIVSTFSWPGSHLTASKKAFVFGSAPCCSLLSHPDNLCTIFHHQTSCICLLLSQWHFSLTRLKFLKKLLHFLEFLFLRTQLTICSLLSLLPPKAEWLSS